MALARERLHPLTRPPTGVLQPTCCNNNEPGKPQCCSCNTPPPPPLSLQRPAAGRAPGVPLVCAAFGASRSQRAEHVLVPIARRDPPPAFHGLRRDVRRARHLCVPHPARHNRSEPSTSPCRSRLVTPHTPATACGGMCAGRATCVCRIRRDAITASLAPSRSRHASPQPPATAGGETCAGAPLVCAAPGASRSQRSEHVPVPFERRVSRDPPSANHGRRRDVRRARHL
jgi:hypothetical protein